MTRKAKPEPTATTTSKLSTPQGDYHCSAEGCPLRASIFDNVTGPPANGRCRYHDAAERKHWPQLTEWFMTLPFVEEVISPRLRSLGLRWMEPPLPSIPPDAEKGPAFHLAKINAILNRPAPPPDTWWHKLITRWRNGKELFEIQRVNAVRAWEASGKPEEWAPPKR